MKEEKDLILFVKRSNKYLRQIALASLLSSPYLIGNLVDYYSNPSARESRIVEYTFIGGLVFALVCGFFYYLVEMLKQKIYGADPITASQLKLYETSMNIKFKGKVRTIKYDFINKIVLTSEPFSFLEIYVKDETSYRLPLSIRHNSQAYGLSSSDTSIMEIVKCKEEFLHLFKDEFNNYGKGILEILRSKSKIPCIDEEPESFNKESA